MKKFISDVLSAIIKNIIVFVFMFLLAISLYTGKFPPNISLIKQQLADLAQAKEKYTNLLNKSEKFLDSKTVTPAEDNIQTTEVITDSTTKESLENIKIEIMHIRSQLNRIEEQNHLLLNSLKK